MPTEMRLYENNLSIPCSYIINDNLLDQVATHKHLGVVISSNLSWKSHVLHTAAKANRILGLLKRTFGKCPKAINIGYMSLVRTILEYACSVCNPDQMYLSNKLERVQHNASRWICGKDIPYEERVKVPD